MISSICAGSIALIASKPDYVLPQNIILMIVLGIVLFLSIIFVSGYCIACGLSLQHLPAWQSWKHLKTGILASCIGLLYSIPFLLLFFTVIGPEQLNAAVIEPSMSVTLVMMLGLFTFYLIPVAILTTMKEKNFKACLNGMVILKKSFSSNYPLAFLVSFVYTFLFIFLVSYLEQWPLAAMIASSFVGFALRVTSMTLYGEALQEIEIVKND